MRHHPTLSPLTTRATALLLGGLLSPAAFAGTTHTVCASGCDFTTIQAAIGAAANGDVIELHELFQTEGGIMVDKDLVIAGVGSPVPTIQAASVPGVATDSVFLIEPPADAVIRDLSVRHGVAPTGQGGGILNHGELVLERVEVVQNEAAVGGGIYSTGRLEVRDGTVSFNSGGGIGATGELVVLGTEVRGNLKTTGLGGGIWSDDWARVEGAVVADNVAPTGGGVWARDLVIRDSLVDGNLAETGGGVHAITLHSINVVYADNTATMGSGGGAFMNIGSVFGGAFVRNSSDLSGGGLFTIAVAQGRSVLVDGVLFESNTATEGGGLIFNVGGVVRNSLFVDNEATETGGGFHLQCCLTVGFSAAVINSTFTGNTARWGGGVYLFGAADFSNVTITDNVADPNSQGGASGGGLFIVEEPGAAAFLRNSIVAGNTDLGPSALNRAADCAGAVHSDGFNSIGTLGLLINLDPACDVSGLPVDVGGDQGLGPLADNGGPTWTHALLEGSANVDTGDPISCRDDLGAVLSLDQRGAERIGACDRGAFERGGAVAMFANGFESGGLWLWSSSTP